MRRFLGDLLRDTADELSELGAKKQVRVELELPENPAHAYGGRSQIIDPRGNFVGERGSGEHEEVLIRDLEMDMVQEMRDDWQFYRDRRPDSYAEIVAP